MSELTPTRATLLELKKRKDLAEKGYVLLKKKRDALVMEFLKFLREIKGERERLQEILREAERIAKLALVLDGETAIRSVAMSVRAPVHVNVEEYNIMGVKVPKIEKEEVPIEEALSFSPLSTSLRIDEISRKFSQAITLVVRIAEIEGAMIRLLHEIERTRRRVNALEYITIPKLLKDIAYVKMKLEEFEREDFVRLKMVKRKIERRAK